MALSADAVRVLQKGGSAAVIIREMETLQNTVKSLAAQFANLQARLVDITNLTLRLKELDKTTLKLWEAVENFETLDELSHLIRDSHELLQKHCKTPAKPEPGYCRWFKKKKESEKRCPRKCSDSGYDSDYDSDL